MTAKERQQMQRLEIENEKLRRRVSEDMRICGDLMIEIIELKTKLELVGSAMRGGE